MPVSTLADATVFNGDGFTFRPLAVPSRGSAELAIWDLEVEPGASSVPHSMDREEVFVLHEGRLAATVGSIEHEIGAGDALIVPAHTELQLRNGSTTAPARLTAITSAGMMATVDGQPFPPPWAQ